MKLLAVVALVLGTVSLAHADQEECKVTNGEVSSSTCRKFSGTTPIEHKGKIQECKITNGEVSSSTCRKFSGKAVIDN